MRLAREKWFQFGGLQLGIAIDERYVGAVRRSLPYRYLLRPAIGALRGSRSRQPRSRNGSGPNGSVEATQPARISPLSPEAKEVQSRISGIDWYQAIDLPHGVVTPGRADHRRQIGLYGLPTDMTGMRVLDVATFDGFWAFEMERRGAEVVAIDIGRWSQADIPLRWLSRMKPEDDAATGDGFRVAKDLLGSQVSRRETSVYDLDPEELGTFDVVFMSDLLLHLRDPQRALEKLYGVTKDDGYALIAEPFSPELEGFKDAALIQFVGYQKFVWAIPSTVALRQMLDLAGFAPVEELSRFQLKYDHPFPVMKVVLKAYPRV